MLQISTTWIKLGTPLGMLTRIALVDMMIGTLRKMKNLGPLIGTKKDF